MAIPAPLVVGGIVLAALSFLGGRKSMTPAAPAQPAEGSGPRGTVALGVTATGEAVKITAGEVGPEITPLAGEPLISPIGIAPQATGSASPSVLAAASMSLGTATVDTAAVAPAPLPEPEWSVEAPRDTGYTPKGTNDTFAREGVQIGAIW